jgi:hypothetical protein
MKDGLDSFPVLKKAEGDSSYLSYATEGLRRYKMCRMVAAVLVVGNDCIPYL